MEDINEEMIHEMKIQNVNINANTGAADQYETLPSLYPHLQKAGSHIFELSENSTQMMTLGFKDTAISFNH